MARGRVLFSEHRRRAASVPIGDLSFPDSSTTSKLYDIKSHVAYDTDALMSASKRRDRDFLHSIQTNLAHTPSLKTPFTLNHNKSRGPPPSRSAYYAVAAAAPSHVPRDLRRRTWYGPATNRVDDYEVAAFLATPIRPPFVSRALRGSSVPPVLPSRGSAPRWYSGARGSSVPRWAPSSYRTYGGGRSYLQSHPDMEDIVVGVAPTALYGDIVIGIPYRKQFMFNVQHGLDSVEDYPRIPVATRVTSPYFAYKNKPLYESPYDEFDVIPYHRATLSTPNYVSRARSSSYWSPKTSEGVSSAPYWAGSRISHYGYPVARTASAKLAPTRSEYDLDLAPSKGESLSNLRLRTSLVRDKANQHKTLLDRYLPLDLSTPVGVTHSYVEAPSRGLSVKTSNPVGSSVHYRATGPTHIPSSGSTAAATGGASPPKPFKPQVSETRQRVRELLCKSKKDPHYFD